VRLPTVVLKAYLSERPVSWKLMTTIPFGERRDQLGYRPAREFATREPTSFAVAQDGSLWIADFDKARIVHYSRRGAFIGSVTHISQHPRDLVFVGKEMWVAHDLSGVLERISADGGVTPFTFQVAGHPVSFLQLLPDGTALLAHANSQAYLGRVEPGTETFVRVDTSGVGGVLSLLPGLPVKGGRSIAVADEGLADFQEIDLRYLSPGAVQVQPFHIDLVTSGAPAGRSVAAIIAPTQFLQIGEDVLMFVAVAPDQPRDAHYGGGHWLLRAGPSSPLWWERLPIPGIDDDIQTRHLAAGPDGSLYMMLLTRRGAQILRHP
jgi:hypothetical protein